MTGRLALAALIAAAPLAAAAQCGPATGIRQWLGAEYGERRIFAGLSRRTLVELWLANTGTWTVLVIAPDGQACVAAAGSDGAVVPPPPPGRPG